VYLNGIGHDGAERSARGYRYRPEIDGLADAGAETRRLRAVLEQSQARLALLADAATAIGTALDPDLTCQELADFLVPRLGDAAVVELLPTDPLSPHRPTAARPAPDRRLRRTAAACAPALRDRWQPPVIGQDTRYGTQSAVARCLAAAQPVLLDLRPGRGPDPAAPESEGSAGFHLAGAHSVLAVPLNARGRIIGALLLARAGDTPGFAASDIAAVQDLANRTAAAVDDGTQHARSQSIAMQLQRALLAEPGHPHLNIELASRYLPSGTSAVVGGDWVETVRLSFGRTLLVIGDVMGHGVEAAVDMSSYRSTLRDIAGNDLPPHRILRQVDELISQSGTDRPATCLLALVDPARERCTFASAGHLPPALLTPGRSTELVEIPTGPPLGTGFGGYEPVTREFGPGQVLLAYTDGLVERRGEDIDASLDRLAGLRLPVSGALDALLDGVLRRLVAEGAEDDIAVLATRIRPRG
jgi:serine phosphatase RsbU (regulator of sigma subunit)